MNYLQIDKIITKLAELSKHEFNYFELKDTYTEDTSYKSIELTSFIDQLIEKGRRISLTILINYIEKSELDRFISGSNFPILVFSKVDEQEIHPILIHKDKKNEIHYYDFLTEKHRDSTYTATLNDLFLTAENPADESLKGQIIYLTAFPFEHTSKDYYGKEAEKQAKPSTIKRLFHLLHAERKDIFYVYVYAVVVGLISLSLPLGIQATISMISGGMIFSSVIVLITLVIIGIVLAGGLQVMQITIVETLQQRIFAKAAFEFAFRVPQIRLEALQKYYPPELMNRFFDVITIQKGLPKLLVEINAAIIQALFCLILLSFYHPFFLVFNLFLLTYLFFIFYLTGPSGLKTSIIESKYKYQVVYWLEELARTLEAFKQAANSNLPLQKMDKLVNNYLHYRKAHFKVLLIQFANLVTFKTLVTGGLLIIGAILVVDRQITLGQFVASEVIIILVVGAIEKLILSMDVVYDLLTGVDKVAQVTDLEVEKTAGFKPNFEEYQGGLSITAKNLKYKYSDNNNYTLQGIDFEIKSGESVCIVGSNDSGKHTLVKILSGIIDNYEGSLRFNNLSIRDLNINAIRNAVNKGLLLEEIFEGNILENITVGRSFVTYKNVVWAIESVGLTEYIAALPEGLNTQIGGAAKKLSSGILSKIILARAIVSKPKLLIISDFSGHIPDREKLKILSFLRNKTHPWTLLILSQSNDSFLLSSCDKILYMQEGKIVLEGTYQKLFSEANFQKFIQKAD